MYEDRDDQTVQSPARCDCYELFGGLGPHDADCPIWDEPEPPDPGRGWQAGATAWSTSAAEMEREA